MNIFIRELRAHRRSLIIWSLSLLALIVLSMNKFSAYSGSGQSMNEIVGKMPKSVQSLMGLGGFDLTTASGYYGVIFFYILILAAVHAVMLGAGIISKEERDKTSEFLFTKPTSRTQVITAKLWAALFNVFVLNIVSLLSSIAAVAAYTSGENFVGSIVKLDLGLLIVQAIFMYLGTGVAAISRRPRTAVSVASGILMAAFLADRIIDMSSSLEFLKYFTPFRYYEASKLMAGKSFDPVSLLLSAVLIAGLGYVTFRFYQKRDLRV